MTAAGGASCGVDGCGRGVQARGLCFGHYQRQRRTGDVSATVPLRETRKRAAACLVEGCNRSSHALGYCNMHHLRVLRNGEPGSLETVRGAYVDMACDVDGCERPARTKGYCPVHYHRVWRTGAPGPAAVRPRRDTPR